MNEWMNEWMNQWMNEVHWFNEAFGLIDFWDEVCISDSCCAFIEAQLIIPGCYYSTTTHASTQCMSFCDICTPSYYHHDSTLDKGRAGLRKSFPKCKQYILKLNDVRILQSRGNVKTFENKT